MFTQRMIRERQKAKQQWFLVFSFSLPKEKTSAKFISATADGDALLRWLLRLKEKTG